MSVDKIISEKLEQRDGIWFGPAGGYWSNLDKEENNSYLKELSYLGSWDTVRRCFPQYFDVIFSPKRAGGLPLLEPNAGEIVVDVGCMWGALTIPLAKAGCHVAAIDQTLESLLLLKQRLAENNLTNVEIICADLKKIRYKESSMDKILVNGVLEWIPESGTVELKQYYGKRLSKKYEHSMRPDLLQSEFLKNIHSGLKDGGRLYLAIENRFDIFYFLGLPDPHCNIRFITFMPRGMQNVISRIVLKRPYVNWTYSEFTLKRMLRRTGFKNINIFYAFPNYRFPEYILTKKGMKYYRPNLYRKGENFAIKALCYAVEDLIFRRLRLKFFSPSFIVIADK